jgi:hypothetical protein
MGRVIYECRCDERLKTKTDGSTHLTCTGFFGGLEHLKIETRLIDESFASVMGECVLEVIGPSVGSGTVHSHVTGLFIMRRPIVVYYEGIKKELKRRPIYESRCDDLSVYYQSIK